jgi:CO/xanthine dehydrogenase Mo-binding subunit
MTIGQGVKRADGRAKVTGQALYVDDIRPSGCLYGGTVRSPHAHAKVLSITRDPGFDWTGITVLTAEDIPGRNCIFLMTEDQPALADGVTRHVEEPVALVAAPTRELAAEAVKHVHVEYQPLEPLFDAQESEGNDPVIFAPDNVFSRIRIEKGDPSKVYAGRVIEGNYYTGLHEQLYIECQGMLAMPRPDGGMTITGSLQCPYYITKAIGQLLGADYQKPGRINVVQACTGGGFGGKEEYPSMVAAHAALLSLHTGKPVKIIYKRDEDLRATTKRHPIFIKIKTRVDDAGRLLTFECDLIVDGGAYNTLTPVVLSRAVIHATGPYRCNHVRIHGRAVATNTPPNGAFRGFGAPQAHFAAERHMDRIARELCLDPIEIRRRNLLRDGDLSATGQEMVDVGAQEVLEVALAAANETPPPKLADLPGGGLDVSRLVQGRGVSLVFHGCGFTGNGEAALKGRVALELRGDQIQILMGSTDIGQGTLTIFPQIVSAELDFPMDRIVVAEPDTARVPDSGPTVASRTAMVVGRVCQEAAQKLKAALQAELGREGPFAELVAERVSEDPLRVEHIYQDDGSLVWDPETYQGDAYPTYGWNCNVVDLTVDLETGVVLYQRLVTATDIGKALNPVLASGQIEGGALQGLGWATQEEVVLDSEHRMRNDRLTNYIIPTSLDAPELKTLLVEIPFEGGPFGAKGLGEIPLDGPAAAVAQAIEAATGAVLDVLPMTPERVLEALP